MPARLEAFEIGCEKIRETRKNQKNRKEGLKKRRSHRGRWLIPIQKDSVSIVKGMRNKRI